MAAKSDINTTVYTAQEMPQQIYHAVQGDSGRRIVITFADLLIPAGAAAYYYVKKPSGLRIFNICSLGAIQNGATNQVICPLTTQALAEVGPNIFQVQVISGSDIITTFAAVILVRETEVDDTAISSTNEFTALEQALQEVQDIINSGTIAQANKLTNARLIGNASFDGTQDVSLDQIGAFPASGGQVDGSMDVEGDFSASGSLSAGNRIIFGGWLLPYIQHGNISVSVTNNTSTNFTISFPKSFPRTPDVVITPRHNSEGANYNLTVKLRSVTASNATGVIYCDGGTATWVIHWTAMYG